MNRLTRVYGGYFLYSLNCNRFVIEEHHLNLVVSPTFSGPKSTRSPSKRFPNPDPTAPAPAESIAIFELPEVTIE